LIKWAWNRILIFKFTFILCRSGFHSSGDSSGESDSDNESNGSNDDQQALLTPVNSVTNSNYKLVCNRNESLFKRQPYCRITLKSTKEVAGFNTISEAFYRLDFCNAIRDIRRFNYICKLLHLLITQNLTSLSGCATKFLFTLLEEVAWQGKLGS